MTSTEKRRPGDQRDGVSTTQIVPLILPDLDAYIADLVAEFPPPTEEQATAVRALFTSGLRSGVAA